MSYVSACFAIPRIIPSVLESFQATFEIFAGNCGNFFTKNSIQATSIGNRGSLEIRCAVEIVCRLGNEITGDSKDAHARVQNSGTGNTAKRKRVRSAGELSVIRSRGSW